MTIRGSTLLARCIALSALAHALVLTSQGLTGSAVAELRVPRPPLVATLEALSLPPQPPATPARAATPTAPATTSPAAVEAPSRSAFADDRPSAVRQPGGVPIPGLAVLQATTTIVAIVLPVEFVEPILRFQSREPETFDEWPEPARPVVASMPDDVQLPDGRYVVQLLALVDPEGRLERAIPLEGERTLVEAARTAVAETGFTPARRNGEAVPGYVGVEVAFQLRRVRAK